MARALRTWRERLDPESYGLTNGPSRRAAGLRREELAMIAGVSVDYLTRLEQDRAQSPSGQILAALARALRLSASEQHYLFLLAGQQPPAGERIAASITPSLRRLVSQLAVTPLGIYDPAWDLIGWNRPFAGLFGEPTALSELERNPAWRQFVGDPSDGDGTVVVHDDEQRERFERALVSDLRTSGARYPADPRLRARLDGLRTRSRRFEMLWAEHRMEPLTMNSKTVSHPELGRLVLDCDVLTVPDADLRIVVCTAAPGTAEAEALRLLTSH